MFKEKGLYFSPISDVHLSTPQEIKRALTATQRGLEGRGDEVVHKPRKRLGDVVTEIDYPRSLTP